MGHHVVDVDVPVEMEVSVKGVATAVEADPTVGVDRPVEAEGAFWAHLEGAFSFGLTFISSVTCSIFHQ